MPYIYGPVSSWRLGKSLGIDLISNGKNCNFDCLYCQLGRSEARISQRKIFVPTVEIIKELKSLLPWEIDFITFSGSGEPTLAANLGEVIAKVKKLFPYKIAVLTNSLLLPSPEVRNELSLADLVVAKLDAATEKTFKKINQPQGDISLSSMIEGIKSFNREFPGKLALQIMFIPENKSEVEGLARLAQEINPREVEINTPLRPCPVKPLPPEELMKIKDHFVSLGKFKVYCVYEVRRPEVKPLDLRQTLKRRPAR